MLIIVVLAAVVYSVAVGARFLCVHMLCVCLYV